MTEIIRKCDRCGGPLKYIGWTCFLINFRKRGSRLVRRKIYNGNPDGYSYVDGDIELCAKCTEELDEFLNAKRKEKIPR